MRQRVIVALVVGMVALSGCGMLGGSGTSADGDPAGNIEGKLDAATGGGEINETALLQDHLTAMTQSAVKLEHRNGQYTKTQMMGPGGTLDLSGETESWAHDGLTLAAQQYGEAAYKVRYDGDGTSDVSNFGIAVRLSTVQLSYNRTVERNGRTLYALDVVGKQGMGRAIEYYTGTALVDTEGRVHRMAGRIGENESVAEEYVYEYDWSVESVPKPSFYDSVPRATASLVDDNRTYKLELTGGATIPAGTELEFYFEESREVTLEESLSPGESLYIGVTESGGDRQLLTAREPLSDSGRVSLSDSEYLQLKGTVTLDDGTKVQVNYFG